MKSNKISNILFYPGAEYDSQPLIMFDQMNLIKTAIYCDYATAINRAQIDEMLLNGGFEINSSRLMRPNEFSCKNWIEFWPLNENNYRRVIEYSCNPDVAFVVKYCITSQKGNKIDFYYFKTEAIRTYELLVNKNLIPNIIVLQDHGLGSLWTNFGLNNNESMLYQQAIQNLPDYLYVAKNTNPWTGYKRVSEYTLSDTSMHQHERALFEKKTD